MQIRLPASSISEIGSDIENIAANYKIRGETTTSSPNIWAICSDEILLKRKVTQEIKKKLYPLSNFNQVVHIPHLSFDWENCLQEAKSLSLFSANKVFDIRLPSGKPGIKGCKALTEWCKNSSVYSNLILNLPAVDFTLSKTSWFNSIDNFGLIINIPTPSNQEMKKWLEKKISEKKISVTKEALDLIIERCEGNLSMADQEIQKIFLLIESEKFKKKIDFDFVQNSVANVSKYNPFDLPNLIFRLRNKKKCIRVIKGLKEEDFPLTLIVWILAQECRKQNSLTKKKLLHKIFLIDKIVKGLIPGDPWIELELFALQDQ